MAELTERKDWRDVARGKTARQLNEESRAGRRARDEAHAHRARELATGLRQARAIAAGATAARRSPRAPAPAPTQSETTSDRVARVLRQARIQTLQAAIAGDRDELEYLRRYAAWFPPSLANPARSATHVPTDAEIVAEARASLRCYGASTAPDPAAAACASIARTHIEAQRGAAAPTSHSASWAKAFTTIRGER